MKSWILVANASEAYIYSSENILTKDMVLVKKLEHPESREKGVELVSDRPGHYQVGDAARSAYEKSDPKAIEADNFARELTHELKKGFNAHDFEQLILVSAPHFYGLINQHMAIHVDNLIHIPKDYTKIKGKQILEQIRKHVFG